MTPFKPTPTRAAKFSALLATAVLSTSAGFAQIPADQISPAALKQIEQILKNKHTYTSAEEKISSNLVAASRLERLEPTGGSDATINYQNIDKKNRASVQINAKVTKELLDLIAANGGKVTAAYKAEGQILAKIPLKALPVVAADAHVRTIDEPDTLLTNVGAVTSQGYITHRANSVVEGLGYDGTGIKVGVLSDSATATTVATLEGTGDLPSNTVVLTPGTGEDEGCAIMEIVHDLAPGAQPYFNTGVTKATFATAITALATAGCTVIVDDISFSNEAAFQDDVVAQAINSFVSGGGIYFSSAANSGNLDSGTSGTWEGDFLSGGPVSTPVSTTDASPSMIHNFGTVANPVLYDTLTVSTTGIDLKWSDPITGGTDDYDLFILDSTGSTVLASSHGRQTGTRAPYEQVSSSAGFAVGDRIVVVQYDVGKTTATRALRIDTERGQLSIATRGSTFGHNAAASVQTMAATFWNSGKLGTVPFTGSTNPVELFSSDGPRAIFYNPNGTQIGTGTPTFSNLAGVAPGGTAGQSLAKPDFTAADGVTCKTTGFSPFFGTSASGPHGAAIAALMKQAKPSITTAQIHTILVNTAKDNGASGFDFDGGNGVLDAYAAVQAALALP